MSSPAGGVGRWLMPLLTTGLLLARAEARQAPPGSVVGTSKISRTQGGWSIGLAANDQIGRAIANLGDLDGDGVIDLAVAGQGDDESGRDAGAVHVLFLQPDGRVGRQTKINELQGGFAGDLDPGDQLGRALGCPGDLDGDGVVDLAVGASNDDDGGLDRGAVWILSMDPGGTVRRTAKISSTAGGFVGPLVDEDYFGRAVASPGDLDGDGIPELAVGAPGDDTGGPLRGAVWILFLRADGSVRAEVKIADRSGGFGPLRNLDWFGFSLAPLGDFDGDGIPDLAVGAALDDDGGTNAGAVWILRLQADGTVKSFSKISATSGGFTGPLDSPDQFGTGVAAVGDLDGNGVVDLVVGAVKDDDGGTDQGAAWVLFLAPDGGVLGHQKISATSGGLDPVLLDPGDWFGSAVAPLGDFNGDGAPDVAIGARNDDDGNGNAGALYLTFLSAAVAGDPPIDPPVDPPVDPPPEPPPVVGGSLELLTPDPGPGMILTLRAGVPDVWRDRSTWATLLFSPFPAVAPYGPLGLQLDPRAVLTASQTSVPAGDTFVDLTLEIPNRPALIGRVIAAQTVWQSRGEGQVSQVIEFVLN